MTQDRETLLKDAELKAEMAQQLINEFVDWREKAFTFAKDKLYVFGMNDRERKKGFDPKNILNALREIKGRPDRLKQKFQWEYEDALRKEKETQEKIRKEQQKQKELQETQDAILWLMERGFILGKDFELDCAIEKANWVAFEEEKNRTLNDHRGFFYFTGDEGCDESCQGWDGVSKRCDCGNRRVDWEMSDYHSFKEPSVIAQAY